MKGVPLYLVKSYLVIGYLTDVNKYGDKGDVWDNYAYEGNNCDPKNDSLLPFLVINNSMLVFVHLPCIVSKVRNWETGDE